MKDIIDDFGKGIDLDRSEIVAYRSSQRVVFSKETETRRNLAQARDYGLIFRCGMINCDQQVAFYPDIKKQKVRFLLRQRFK